MAAHGHDHGDEIAAHTHEPHRHHKHRGMNEICQILADTKMTDSARGIALKIFQILARAEAKAHNVPVEEVHFHEVGRAVDSIVDIFVRGSLPGQYLELQKSLYLYYVKEWVRSAASMAFYQFRFQR